MATVLRMSGITVVFADIRELPLSRQDLESPAERREREAQEALEDLYDDLDSSDSCSE